MAQQLIVKMPNGSVYEFDSVDFQYYCIHDNIIIEDAEVDYFDPELGHNTYAKKIAYCANIECNKDLSETIDWSI